jgi:hypothetical protein
MSIDEEYREITDFLVYIQLMGSFLPFVNFSETKSFISATHDAISKYSDEERSSKLPEIKEVVEKMSANFIRMFPIKKSISDIATSFNDYYKNENDIYSFGIEYGWLEQNMDLTKLKFYPDMPFHYKIGLASHKGNGGIEEDFLLKDAFNAFSKAEDSFRLLLNYGNILKKIGSGAISPEEQYKSITDIKYDVCAYSRLTILSFYSFVECFVNSVGYNYFYRNYNSLTPKESELLQGQFKDGRYLNLKSKIEKFQTIIRPDKKPKIILSDEKQLREPFKSFFEDYEHLRNAAVHYSPIKNDIWLKPDDWIEKARRFCKISLAVGLEFWKASYPTSGGPEYLGKLDFSLHHKLSMDRIMSVKKSERLLIENLSKDE